MNPTDVLIWFLKVWNITLETWDLSLHNGNSSNRFMWKILISPMSRWPNQKIYHTCLKYNIHKSTFSKRLGILPEKCHFNLHKDLFLLRKDLIQLMQRLTFKGASIDWLLWCYSITMPECHSIELRSVRELNCLYPKRKLTY